MRDISTFGIKQNSPRVTKISFGLFQFLFGVIGITSEGTQELISKYDS